MDPDVLLQIATMYDGLDEEDQAKAYMELCVAQEDGGAVGVVESGANLNESVAIHHDSPGGLSDGEGGGEGKSQWTKGAGADDEEQANNEGTGVTAATSKARMWLARYAMRAEDYTTADRLATELIQDGVEVEEAKALKREAQSRMEELVGPMER